MSQQPPLVSIGLAVYNGELYLEQALQSILAQTYTNFELIISDNASTDRTADICLAYAAKDSRIRYSRNPVNIGGTKNENLTFSLARGQYFRWAAYDDVCAPELLAKCVEVLDQEPSVVLCSTQIVEIDQNGDVQCVKAYNLATSESSYKRFQDLAFRKNHNCEATYGLIRASVLRKTDLFKYYSDCDRTLLCELALHGRFHEVPEPLFFKRWHPKNQHLDLRARMAWFNPDLKGKITFPNWLQFFDLLATIRKAPISGYDKFCCYLVMGRWLFVHGRSMAKDLAVALAMKTQIGTWKRHDASLYNWE